MISETETADARRTRVNPTVPSEGFQTRSRPLSADLLVAIGTPGTWMLLAGSVVMAVVFAVANLSRLDVLASEQSVRIAMHSATVAPLVFAAIAGAVATTSDLRYATIDQRLLSNPSRLRWFVTKEITSATIGAVYGLVGVGVAALSVYGYYSVSNVPLALGSDPVLRALVGTVLATPLLAVAGAAVGLLIRSQPGTVGAVVVWLFVIEPPVLLGVAAVGRWLPGAAALALTNSPDPDLLSQPMGALVLATWTASFIAAASWNLSHNDI